MSADTAEVALINLSKKFAAEQGIPLGEATKLAALKLADAALAWRASVPVIDAPVSLSGDAPLPPLRQLEIEVRAELDRRMADKNLTAASSAAISLSAKAGEDFDTFAMRIADVRGISLREGIHIAGQLAPQLAANR